MCADNDSNSESKSNIVNEGLVNEAGVGYDYENKIVSPIFGNQHKSRQVFQPHEEKALC